MTELPQIRQGQAFKTNVSNKVINLSDYVSEVGGSEAYYSMKRMIDIVVGCLALLLALPLFCILALLIQLDSPGPIMFSQKRVGSRRVRINGQYIWELYPYTMYKFRTMVDNAPEDIHQQFVQAYIHDDADAMTEIKKEIGDVLDAEQTDGQYKLESDPRVTRIGKFLRKTSLDELPQLINVIRGEMSLVGPRPPLPYEVREYKHWHMQRFAAYQGMTGYWQVTARSEASFDKMVDLDIWYTKHQSLFLDFKILLLTPFKVLKGKGAK
jgi:lipopolysaccharide/colanic/teichoic acid biosynthesis glycosyltransferase